MPIVWAVGLKATRDLTKDMHMPSETRITRCTSSSEHRLSFGLSCFLRHFWHISDPVPKPHCACRIFPDVAFFPSNQFHGKEYKCWDLTVSLMISLCLPWFPCVYYSWFPCVYKWMLRWFPSFQVATTCFSCSPPDLNFLVTFFHIYVHVK